MKAAERHEKILQLLKEKDMVTIVELKECMPNVSEMTFRRDLFKLAEENKLIRVYGGAKSIDLMNVYMEEGFKHRLVQKSEEKKVIAEKVSHLVKETDRIYLDSGSTCTYIAMNLEDKEYDITTNGLTCAMELVRLPKVKITMVGGSVYGGSFSTKGDISVVQVENQFWDIAFVGTIGYVPGIGFMSSVLDDYVLKRKIVQNSKKVVIVMDHTKVGKRGTHLIAKIPEVYAVVSDDELPKDIIEDLKSQNIIVM